MPELSTELSSILRDGRELAEMPHPVYAHSAFTRWVTKVAEWLRDSVRNPILEAEWSALGMSTLVVGGHYYEDLGKWNEFHDLIRKRLNWLAKVVSRVVAAGRDGDRGSEIEQTMGHARVPVKVDRKKVFVVHGRNVNARNAMFTFLRSLGLHPIEWSQAIGMTGTASPFIGQILETVFGHAGAVVVLMTGDDIACLRPDLVSEDDAPHEKNPTPQARPNVLFEAGMAMGRCLDRTILVELGSLRPFSDIGGRHVVRLDDSTQRRQDLADRLRTAGCPVDISGRDWQTAGDFNGSIASGSADFPAPESHPDLSEMGRAFAELNPKMQDLLAEMKVDIENDDTRVVREFALLPSRRVGFPYSKPRFVYYADEHLNLQNKIDLLEQHYLVSEVTTGNTPIYRMTEEFVQLLLKMDG